MEKTLEEAERIIKQLSISDRQVLLQKLIDEADPIDSEIQNAWVQESKSRLEGMRAGRLELIDEDSALSQAEQSLNEEV